MENYSFVWWVESLFEELFEDLRDSFSWYIVGIYLDEFLIVRLSWPCLLLLVLRTSSIQTLFCCVWEWVSSPQDHHLLHIFDVKNSPSVIYSNLKRSQMKSARFINLQISNCIYTPNYFRHAKISACWLAKNTWIIPNSAENWNWAHNVEVKLINR